MDRARNSPGWLFLVVWHRTDEVDPTKQHTRLQMSLPTRSLNHQPGPDKSEKKIISHITTNNTSGFLSHVEIM